MTLASKSIDTEMELTSCAMLIPLALPLIPVAKQLCTGLIRGAFFGDICYSLHGVYTIEDGVGDAWMVSERDLLKRFPITPHRSAKQVIWEAFDKFEFKRIQMTVPNDFHVKWCESIGFVLEKINQDKAHLSICPHYQQ